jgi:hypothetical protein
MMNRKSVICGNRYSSDLEKSGAGKYGAGQSKI